MISHANVNNDKQDLVADDYSYDQAKKVKWHNYILLNRPLKVILTVIIVGILVPVLLYQYIFVSSGDWPPQDGYSTGTCLLSRTARLPCGYGSMPQSDCHSQCCYDLNSNMCFHRYPSRFSYIFNQQWNENVTFVSRIQTIPYRDQLSTPTIKISIDEISASHLSLTFYDAQNTHLTGSRLENRSYEYTLLPQELSITVNSIQGTIFDTVRGPLIASNNIWEIAFRLTNETMYGLGEIPLLEGTMKVLYNHDGGLTSIPLIFAKSNGSYHGLLIDIKDPTEIIIGGENQLVVRSLTGLGLKFHVFVGPKPSDVMNDVRKLLGSNPPLEYWMLGAHICNEVEGTPTEALKHLTDFTTAANQAQLPYESNCGAGPVVLQNNCQNQSETRYIDEGGQLVKNAKRRFIPHLSPYIRYAELNNSNSENSTETSYRHEQVETTTDHGEEEEPCVDMSVDFGEFMIQDSNFNGTYKGVVGTHSVIYPTYENITEDFMQNVWPHNVALDGVILENTWPLDEALKNHSYAYSALPYYSKYFEAAFNQTLLWNTTFSDGSVYYHKHNEYSNNFINAVKFAFDGIPTWSSSQWLNGDVMINRQNVRTSWASLHRELMEAALGGVSGHWLWSTPICGDTDNYNSTLQSELCLKWYSASTYMPMIKIHSKGEERHPLSFEGTERTIAMNALRNRLTLLPYIFTVLEEGPLLRPMFYQFPESDFLSNVTTQYSVGNDLLIVPNLVPNQGHVHVRVPPGTWFELWGGMELAGEEGDTVAIADTVADMLTFMRAGSVIVMQKNPSPTAEVTRLQAFLSLTIALQSETLNVTDHENVTTEVETYHASGKFYLSQNLTLLFEADEEKLRVIAIGDDFTALCSAAAVSNRFITELKIFGLPPERNNYDNYRQISAVVMLCNLETQPEVISVFT